MTLLFLGIVAFIAGVMNAMAGGGSFLMFPALVFTGMPSIIANASSTVGLHSGGFASTWAYRKNFRNFEGVPLIALLGVCLAGGTTGALLLLTTSQRAFDIVIPWLLLAASLVFAFGPKIAPVLAQRVHIGPRIFLLLQFIVSIYGGYFGGAVGIVSMALWSLLGHNDIHEMNAAKALVVVTMNTAAVVCFIIADKVSWPETIVMILGAITGGYIGARVARRIPGKYLRWMVIAISFGVTTAFFVRLSG